MARPAMIGPRGRWGRFDDLQTGSATRFSAVESVLAARTFDDVGPTLTAVEEAVIRGQWAFGFVAYEAAPAFDPALAVHKPAPDLPLAWFGICSKPEDIPVVRAPLQPRYHVGAWRSEWSSGEHRRKVLAVQRNIQAGETYQCNLTTRFTAPIEGDLHDFYADLVLAQQGAHNAFLDIGSHVIASASPELFFQLNDRQLLLRPMKGTARRGRTPSEDALLVAGLLASEKERAENLMIVDLLRNDAARIAEIGSVRVRRLFHPERYKTVHQLTSDITARISSHVGLVDVFAALFPCGSVTGAPKHTTMGIIRDLEHGPRGVYCGAIGVVSPTPVGSFRARFSVGIRTATVDRATRIATYGSGGAITWSSQPEAEHAEIQLKAALLPGTVATQGQEPDRRRATARRCRAAGAGGC